MRRQVEFDGSYRVRSREERVRGNTYRTGTGLPLRYVHPPTWCEGRYCVIHNPSDHAMRLFPTHWRMDRHIMERICPHGVGHPDPDDQSYLHSIGLHSEGVHGCDGCCRPEIAPSNPGLNEAGAQPNPPSMDGLIARIGRQFMARWQNIVKPPEEKG